MLSLKCTHHQHLEYLRREFNHGHCLSQSFFLATALAVRYKDHDTDSFILSMQSAFLDGPIFVYTEYTPALLRVCDSIMLSSYQIDHMLLSCGPSLYKLLFSFSHSSLPCIFKETGLQL